MTDRENPDVAVCKMCGREYHLDGEVAGVLGQLAPGEDVSGPAGSPGVWPAGKEVELDLCGLPVSAMLVGPDSPARQQGFDVLVLVCSVECVTAIRLAAELDASADGHEVDPDAPGVHWLRLWRPEQLMTARSLEKLELFESTLRTVAPDLAKRLGCDRPAPRAMPDASPETRAAMQELLGQACAWCLRTIGNTGQRLPVWMQDEGDLTGEGRVVVFKVGERVVPAQRVEPRSPESADSNAIFHLCSKTCATDLAAAIAYDRRLRVVH